MSLAPLSYLLSPSVLRYNTCSAFFSSLMAFPFSQSSQKYLFKLVHLQQTPRVRVKVALMLRVLSLKHVTEPLRKYVRLRYDLGELVRIDLVRNKSPRSELLLKS